MNSSSEFALFNYGFRPFFLLAGLYAVIAMLIWLTIHIIGIWPIGTPTSYLWHAHEMLFGFVGAAIAGFLLTAVPSWTGQRGFSGLPLIILVVVWLGGRLGFPFYAHLPSVFIAIVDLAFFPVLGLMLTPSLIKGKSRNLVFLLFLLFLFSANLIFHVALVQNNVVFASYGLLFGINIVLLIITIIGGRIVPAFTLSAIRRTDDTFVIMPCPALDRIAIASILLVLITDLIWPYSAAAGWLALIAALIHAVRLARWQTLRGLGEAIVWILHIGYAWVIIGPALGHTGRPLIAPPLIVVSYVLLTLATIVRVSGPVFPEVYLYNIAVSGVLWIGAFILFLVVYTPILIGPRADGKKQDEGAD